MQYYDIYSAKFKNDLNFTETIRTYTPAMNLEPECVDWSKDGKTLYISLQENSALVKHVPATGATTIHPYGLKDWSETKIDTDGSCAAMAVKPGFKTLRNPDSISVFSVGGARPPPETNPPRPSARDRPQERTPRPVSSHPVGGVRLPVTASYGSMAVGGLAPLGKGGRRAVSNGGLAKSQSRRARPTRSRHTRSNASFMATS